MITSLWLPVAIRDRLERSRRCANLEVANCDLKMNRGQKVILDADLGVLYGTSTKRLNEQVRRNCDRFPQDFMFQLTKREKAEVVANCDHLIKELAHKLAELERKLQNHDESIRSLVVAIRQLMEAPEPEPETPKRRIGFLVEEPQVPYESKRQRRK